MNALTLEMLYLLNSSSTVLIIIKPARPSSPHIRIEVYAYRRLISGEIKANQTERIALVIAANKQ